jgi:hypothetical protein
MVHTFFNNRVAKAHGALCALYIVWLNMLPYPVAPWIILLIVSGFESVFDESLIPSLNTEFAYLLEWPKNHTVPLDLSLYSSASRVASMHLANIPVGSKIINMYAGQLTTLRFNV